ncbi:MAG: DUF5317 domain-containing protein [Frankiaceae bacterium]
MALVAIVLALAVLLGRALSGRLRRLAALPVAGWPLLVLAALAEIGGGLAARAGSGSGHVAGAVAATALVVAFLAVNRALQGIPLVAGGLLLNALVIAANGAMPVSAWAATRAGVDVAPIAAGLDQGHALLGAGTALPALADRIPLPLPVVPEVLSAGDVLIAAGLGLLVLTGMTTGARYDDGLRRRRSDSG